MDVLVTGGTGFIGINLIKRLSNNPNINLFYTTGSFEDKVGISRNIGRELNGLDWSMVKHLDVLYHQAGCVDSTNPEILKINVEGSLDVFENAARKGCKNIVYASTVGVYGLNSSPFIEYKTSLSPVNEYAKSKLELERRANEFAKENKSVNVVGLRYSNVYGPFENSRNSGVSVVKKWAQDIYSGEEIEIFGDGNIRRDLVYVNDVVWANLMAGKSRRGGVYNIGSGESKSFNEIAWIIGKVVGREPVIKYDSEKDLSGFPKDTLCDISLAEENLSYSPVYGLEKGITTYFKSGELV